MKKIIIVICAIFILNNVFAADDVKDNSKNGKSVKPKTAVAAADKNKDLKKNKNKDADKEANKDADKEDLTVRIYFSMPNLQLGIFYFYNDENGKARETREIKYLPNVNMSMGADVSYGIYGFSYSREIPDSGEDRNKYGKSKYNDFQFYYYGDKLGADVYYQKYSGFYLENGDALGYSDNPSVFKRSDLSMISAGLNLYYSFSDEFSLNKAFKVTRNPIKNGGSFLLMLSPNYFGLLSSRSLILPDQEDLYGEYSGFYKGRYLSVALSPGYAYAFTADNGFCFSASVFGGLGIMNKDYSTSGKHVLSVSSSIKANVKFQLGYNGDSIFYGLTGLGDGTSARDPFADTGLSVMSYVISVELFFGMRF